MIPEGDPDGDGLTREQLRWLVGVGIAVGLAVVVLVVGLTAASHVLGIGGGQDGPPDATFSVRTQAAADGVAANLTHRGGEAAAPEDLVISVNGERRGTWTAVGGEAPGLVAEGHTAIVRDVEPGDVVLLHWVGDGEETLLARGTVDEEPEA